MYIKIRYEENDLYDDGRKEVFANDVNIGYLNDPTNGKETLCWSPNAQPHIVKFQFRKDDTFLQVVEELRRYKNEKGYRYLSIWKHNYGFAEIIDDALLKRAGFFNHPDRPVACLDLE